MTELADATYVLLTTFRKDATPVPTPVWAAADDAGRLLVWSSATAGKVKRIRRSGEVLVQPCSARGRPRGTPVAGHAVLLDGPASDDARQRIRRKYGIPGALAMLASTVTRGRAATCCLAVTVDGAA